MRIQQFVQAFGDNGTFESICDGDFSPAMARIGDKIAGRIRHQCLEQPPVDRDPARPGGKRAGRSIKRRDQHGPVRTSINSCDDAMPPCWRIHPTAPAPEPAPKSSSTADRSAPPRTVITVLCETCQTAEDPRCSGG